MESSQIPFSNHLGPLHYRWVYFCPSTGRQLYDFWMDYFHGFLSRGLQQCVDRCTSDLVDLNFFVPFRVLCS